MILTFRTLRFSLFFATCVTVFKVFEPPLAVERLVEVLCCSRPLAVGLAVVKVGHQRLEQLGLLVGELLDALSDEVLLQQYTRADVHKSVVG